MSKQKFTICALLLIASPICLADNQLADKTAKNAKQNDHSDDGHFVVHEWGTFTTFSGSDGLFLDFRPLAGQNSDLPPYVLGRASYSTIPRFAKSRLWGRVRMETPVTYFYTDRVRTVDVRVDFPQGLLTDFYPPVREMLPVLDEKKMFAEGESIGNSSLDWGSVELIPTDQLLPNVTDPAVRKTLTSDLVDAILPHATNENHYVQARNTDAAIVHFSGEVKLPNCYYPRKSYFEKFLFYRGVGKFQLPYSATFSKNGISFNNSSNQPMRSAILIDIDGDKVRAAKLNQVKSATSVPFPETEGMTAEQLGVLVESCLVDEGLYEKEAAAMVKTWEQSWFTENGTRILYMVPPATTDELLPLHITPSPQETLRVLVGRMEVMSPRDEKRMVDSIAKSAEAREAYNSQLTPEQRKKKPFQIPAAIREFGRMAEPALIRVSKIVHDPAIEQETNLLIAQLRRSQ